jgi:hypothetical protein
MEPWAVVDIALKKLRRSGTVVAGWKNAITVFATRLLPRSWNATIDGGVLGGMLRGAKTPSQHATQEARQNARN